MRLNEAGLDAVAAGRLDLPDEVLAPGADAAALATPGCCTALIDDGLDRPRPVDGRVDFRRYAELAERATRFTVGLFELPQP